MNRKTDGSSGAKSSKPNGVAGKVTVGEIQHDNAWQDARWRGRVRTSLAKWFGQHARTLPWRTDPIAYRVWVSEVMLQQTQVATVLPYFDRFMKLFPTVTALADADEQDLMKQWEGLGYYRRARSMHAAAKKIVDEHDGKFPESFDDVLALPGIGRYTAGAILSIARDQRHPILEGNTVRVFSRWIALRDDVTSTPANRLLWEVAEAMLPPATGRQVSAGTFNQAAMELGALICTPKAPKCDQCPVAKTCRAHAGGWELEIPGKVSKTVYESRTEFAFVVRKQAKKKLPATFLMRPIPAGSRWAGLWDFPRTIQRSLDSPQAAAAELAPELGSIIEPAATLTTIKHAVTKYRIALHVHGGDLPAGSPPPPPPWEYVTLDQMAELPLSVTGRRIAKLLAG
ncbi:A/G-specific adenine glycosylase [Rubripirellula lacrimiformis]|uniref:Adenine DNA glycosylase n=1 Tax=Rubripirellula lacrimiformis TaxID=1930273 RepID=A0A517NFQ1_9BACT|nr:A/G-specific adenine glycosylase [Rubripirellula lacrimiformis]QDT05947.1 A/G-specific adenine glycosylase [Rubripirellula lacrimiformis]